MPSLKLQTRWDKTVFFGSIIGSIIILFLTFFKCGHNSGLDRENQMLKKENAQLKQQIISLEKK